MTQKQKTAHRLVRSHGTDRFLKQSLQIDDQFQLIFFSFLPVQSSKHTHQRIYPEQETAHLPFVVMIPLWRFHRDGISRILTRSDVTSVEKKKSTTSASCPGLFHNVEKRGDKNRVKSQLSFKRHVLLRSVTMASFSLALMILPSEAAQQNNRINTTH